MHPLKAKTPGLILSSQRDNVKNTLITCSYVHETLSDQTSSFHTYLIRWSPFVYSQNSFLDYVKRQNYFSVFESMKLVYETPDSEPRLSWMVSSQTQVYIQTLVFGVSTRPPCSGTRRNLWIISYDMILNVMMRSNDYPAEQQTRWNVLVTRWEC